MAQENHPRYAGIGSRETPRAVVDDMTRLAGGMEAAGWVLRSGGARGADAAFAAGVRHPSEGLEIFTPWNGFNGLRAGMPGVYGLEGGKYAEAVEIAAGVHPAWHRVRTRWQPLHARNAAILLGADLRTPVKAVVCWTVDGGPTGGTGLGIRLAWKYGIPVYNFADARGGRGGIETALKELAQAA